MRIHVRDILKINIQPRDYKIPSLLEVIDNFEHLVPETCTLVFDNGEELFTGRRKLFTSRIGWLLLDEYPNVRLNKDLYITSSLKEFKYENDDTFKEQVFISKTHRVFLTAIYKAIIKDINPLSPYDFEKLTELIIKSNDLFYNYNVLMSEEYYSSLDILDLIELIDHKPIKKLVKQTEKSKGSVGNTFKDSLNIIYTDKDIRDNQMVKMVKRELVNSLQISQSTVFRGFVTEVDGSILQEPILSNYVSGINSMFEVCAESLMAHKAYKFAEVPLQKAEYLSRKLQLLATIVNRIEQGDCGSQRYLEFKINPPSFNARGDETQPGDLVNMVGKIYLDPETGTLKELTGKESHFYNKTLLIRSAIHCSLLDKQAVCSVCFGGLSRNVSRFTNIGHISAGSTCEKTTSSVLATKHLDFTSAGVSVKYGVDSLRIFKPSVNKDGYVIREFFKDKEVTISINSDEAVSLMDIHVLSISEINPMKITAISKVTISYTEDGHVFQDIIDISHNRKKSILSKAFLLYLKTKGWGTDKQNNFVFTLDDWDFDQEIFKLPDLEYSYSDHSRQFAELIESTKVEKKSLTEPNCGDKLVVKIFNLLNSKLSVNLACIEILVYSVLTPGEDSYDLSRNSYTTAIRQSDSLNKGRSMGVAYGFQAQLSTMTDVSSFYNGGNNIKIDSIFDVLLMPKEYYESLTDK